MYMTLAFFLVPPWRTEQLAFASCSFFDSSSHYDEIVIYYLEAKKPNLFFNISLFP